MCAAHIMARHATQTVGIRLADRGEGGLLPLYEAGGRAEINCSTFNRALNSWLLALCATALHMRTHINSISNALS